jgi:hypothetical protein
MSLTAAAQTTTITPIAVNTSTSFIGTGFTAGELISLWTTMPGSTVTPLDGTIADSSGSFSVQISFPSGGSWAVTAHGQTSGHEVIGAYAVGDTTAAAPGTPLPGLPGTTLPAQGTGTLPGPDASAFPQVAVSAPITFSGTGFTGNEPIVFWQTAPDSTVSPILGTQSTDGAGAFTANVSFGTPGFWQVTAHGINSGHEVIGRYVVGGRDASTAPGVTTPATTATATTVGTTVTFPASGFTPGETVSAWTTAPDSTTTSLGQAVADSQGNVSFTTSFPVAGFWQITAHGVSSAHEIIGQYRVS